MSDNRIESIDVFRGLTILAMIFVNDLASVSNISPWLKHMPQELDGMTLVDVVFPAFLFIVGMSLPFALKKREEKSESKFKIWIHILTRTAGLLILGILMVNMHSISFELTGYSSSLWSLLVYVSAIMLWLRIPKKSENKFVYIILKIIGATLLIVLVSTFRSGTIENPGWLETKWWGILGLIGWAYLTTSIIYFIFRDNLSGLVGIFAFLIFVYIGDKEGALDFLDFIGNTLWIGGFIAGHAAFTLAGVITSVVLKSKSNFVYKFRWFTLFALLLFVSGYLLRPLYGINKVDVTPSWIFYSTAICVLIFLFLYWLIDLKGYGNYFSFVKPAGSNPLLAYLLPGIFYSVLELFGIKFYGEVLGDGLTGIFRSFFFSLIILYITALFNKVKVFLHL